MDNYFNVETESSNGLIVNICVSIISAIFFYILLVYLPDRRKHKIARMTISANLNKLASSMQKVISYVHFTHMGDSINHNEYYSDISLDCFQKIGKLPLVTNETSIRGGFEVSRLNPMSKKWKPTRTCLESVNFNVHRELALQCIDNILHRPIVIYESTDLLEILSNIELCEFLGTILTANKVSGGGEDMTLVVSGISEYYELYIKLLKYTTPNTIYKIYKFH